MLLLRIYIEFFADCFSLDKVIVNDTYDVFTDTCCVFVIVHIITLIKIHEDQDTSVRFNNVVPPSGKMTLQMHI